MKANELQLGDLVLIGAGYVRVNAIYPELIRCGVNNCSPSEVCPIKLTPEILEKNGWKKEMIDDEPCYTLLTSDCFLVKRTDRTGYWKYDSIRNGGKGIVFQGIIDYAHELQHCLRLCGLNGLADNFKI